MGSGTIGDERFDYREHEKMYVIDTSVFLLLVLDEGVSLHYILSYKRKCFWKPKTFFSLSRETKSPKSLSSCNWRRVFISTALLSDQISLSLFTCVWNSATFPWTQFIELCFKWAPFWDFEFLKLCSPPNFHLSMIFGASLKALDFDLYWIAF